MKSSTAMAMAALILFSAALAKAEEMESGAPDETMKAEELQQACNPAASLDQAAKDRGALICRYYFRGLADGMFIPKVLQASNAPDGCMPVDGPIPPSESRKDFLAYMTKQPEMAQRSSGMASIMAIIQNYPCE